MIGQNYTYDFEQPMRVLYFCMTKCENDKICLLHWDLVGEMDQQLSYCE